MGIVDQRKKENYLTQKLRIITEKYLLIAQ
jgi:hypothetical protein